MSKSNIWFFAHKHFGKATAISSPVLTQSKKAFLTYQTVDIEQWTTLDEPEENTRFSVRKAIFSGGVQLSQWNEKQHGICEVVFKVTSAKVIWNGVAFDIECRGVKVTSCTYGSNTGIKEAGIAIAKHFPLSTLCRTMTAFRLTCSKTNVNKDLKFPSQIEGVRSNIETILTQPPFPTVENDEILFVNKVFNTLLEESVAQQKLLCMKEGCRIKASLHPRQKQIVVEVWPRIDYDKAELDIGNHAFAQRYIVKSKALFSKSTSPFHPIFGSASEDWEINVVPKDLVANSDASIIGIIQNSFASAADYIFQLASDTEEDVILEPIFEDTLGERARASVKELREDFVTQQDETIAALEGKIPLELPTRMMFLKDIKYDVEQNTLPKVDPGSYSKFVNRLYPAQQAAIEMALKHKVSTIFGPATTGKSFTLAALIMSLANNGDKVVVSSPTNVGVDALVQKLSTEAPKFGFPPRSFFVRLYSTSQIRAQYALTQVRVLTANFHIEQIQLRLANMSPDAYQGFLKEIEELRKYGTISAKEDQKKYNVDSSKLTKEILGWINVVFCTNANLRSSALGPKVDGKRQWWPATTIIMDEAGCANPGEVIMPVITFATTLRRYVLAGDPCQLPPFALTVAAKQLYKKSTFESLMDQEFPMTMLNRKFRTHSEAYDPVGHVVYKNAVSSEIETSRPTAALTSLLQCFPLEFRVGSKIFSATTFINFFDIEDGEAYSDPNGSCSNEKEVAAVGSLVKALKGVGQKDSNICVMTGYCEQAKALKKHGKANDWGSVKVCTIDSTQGQEWDIVILSTVKTQGDPGFIGTLNRANVACSRHKLAIFLVGKFSFWQTHKDTANKYMGELVRRMFYTSEIHSGTNRPALVVR